MSLTFTDLSYNIHTEVQALQLGHAHECSRHDFCDEIPAEIQVLQGSQRCQIHLSHGLK